MKKFTLTLICVLISCFFIGCDTKKDINKECIVNFITNSDFIVESQKVKQNQKLGEVVNPTKENYEFLGWTLEENGDVIDLKTFIVDKTITLYAKWDRITKYDLKDYIIKIAYLRKPKFYEKDLETIIKDVEEEFNCHFQFEMFPESDRSTFEANILMYESYKNHNVQHDFYWLEGVQLGDYHNEIFIPFDSFKDKTYKSFMNNVQIEEGTVDNELLALTIENVNVFDFLTFNVDLFNKLKTIDPTLEEPGTIFLNGNWNLTAFKNYLVKVQKAMEKLDDYKLGEYYALDSNVGQLFFGLTATDGIKMYDFNNNTYNFHDETREVAVNFIKELKKLGVLSNKHFNEGIKDTAFINGKSLFTNIFTTELYNKKVNWDKNIWGENPKLGYVPWPMKDNKTLNDYKVCIGFLNNIYMAKGKEHIEGIDEEMIYMAMCTLLKRISDSRDYNKINIKEMEKVLSTDASLKSYKKVLEFLDNDRGYCDLVGSNYIGYNNCSKLVGALNEFLNNENITWQEALDKVFHVEYPDETVGK